MSAGRDDTVCWYGSLTSSVTVAVPSSGSKFRDQFCSSIAQPQHIRLCAAKYWYTVGLGLRIVGLVARAKFFEVPLFARDTDLLVWEPQTMRRHPDRGTALTWSHIPVVAERFRPDLSTGTRLYIIAGQDGVAVAGCTPVPSVNAQSFQGAARSVGSGVFQRVRADWCGGKLAYGAVLAVFP